MSRRAKGQAQADESFPVLEEKSLPYIPARPFARRDRSQLPCVRPGTVLVFRHGSKYEALSKDGHLSGREDIVVDAAEVSLVDLRPRNFPLFLPLPSAHPADDFTIKVQFQAHVTDAERAAEHGPLAMASFLTSYLAKDVRLTSLGSGQPVENIAEVRKLVSSQIEAYCELNPIHLPGLAVQLDTVDVLTPRELRAHDQRLRDEHWNQEERELQAKGDVKKVEPYEELVKRGPDALTAFGLANGQTTANEAIAYAVEAEKRQVERYASAFSSLEKQGRLDLLDIDATELARLFLDNLAGQPISRVSHAALTGRDLASANGTDPGDDHEDDDQPNEADLDEL
jgi:hypothetical protein